MGGYLVYCMVVCYFLFFSIVTDFSVAEKDRGVKFCMLVIYYPGRTSPILVNFGGITSAMYR